VLYPKEWAHFCASLPCISRRWWYYPFFKLVSHLCVVAVIAFQGRFIFHAQMDINCTSSFLIIRLCIFSCFGCMLVDTLGASRASAAVVRLDGCRIVIQRTVYAVVARHIIISWYFDA
jgi:hypothetical protein